jgi:hypothetical protein
MESFAVGMGVAGVGKILGRKRHLFLIQRGDAESGGASP